MLSKCMTMLMVIVLSTSQAYSHTLSKVIHYKKKGISQQATTGPIIGQVRQGDAPSINELAALQNRLGRNRNALQKLLGQSYPLGQNIPMIAVAASGGGFRAAIATLGLLRGLERIGLLDAVTYIASLSGSTWTTASWYTHKVSPIALTSRLQSKLYEAFSLKNIDEKAITRKIASKAWQGKSIGLNDLWGNLIGNVFLSSPTNHGLDLNLEDIAPQTLSGDYPVPLFTSIIGQTNPDYQWVEYSPFEIGSTYFKAWIQPQLFGKTFKNGVTQDTSPGENLAFMMGIFGSAYAGSVIDALQFIKEGLQVSHNIDISSSWFNWFWGNNARISAPEIPNFVHGLQAPLGKAGKLTLVDAGMATNIPFPPLLRRGVKIYFVCDAGTDANSVLGTDMREVENWARAHGYKFPKIDYAQLAEKPLSVWADPTDKQTPIIIHVPNKLDFPTSKFSYTGKEFFDLYKSIENAVTHNTDAIAKALTLALSQIN